MVGMKEHGSTFVRVNKIFKSHCGRRFTFLYKLICKYGLGYHFPDRLYILNICNPYAKIQVICMENLCWCYVINVCVKSVRNWSYSCPNSRILHLSPYSAPMRENADQNNSKYKHFLRSGSPSNVKTKQNRYKAIKD